MIFSPSYRANESITSLRLILHILESTYTTFPSTGDTTADLESTATFFSIPVPTIGDSGFIKGTDCLCIFDPIKARFASSCSRKGISAAATLSI